MKLLNLKNRPSVARAASYILMVAEGVGGFNVEIAHVRNLLCKSEVKMVPLLLVASLRPLPRRDMTKADLQSVAPSCQNGDCQPGCND